MKIVEALIRINELCGIEITLTFYLGQFKETCQDSPLTNQEKDSYIEMYKALIDEIKTIHGHVVDSYLAWIVEPRES